MRESDISIMTNDEILKLWRQHYEVLGFAHALMDRVNPTKREPVAYLATNALGFKFFRVHRPDDTYKPVALYDLRAEK